jgi:hypothetical protein
MMIFVERRREHAEIAEHSKVFSALSAVSAVRVGISRAL